MVRAEKMHVCALLVKSMSSVATRFDALSASERQIDQVSGVRVTLRLFG